jgi:hypothetical protein
MVKSGEVQVGPLIQDNDGYLEHDSRPRNIMVPIGHGYSVIAAL